MIKERLQRARIRRGGRTARQWRNENAPVDLYAHSVENGFDLLFSLASKGGGTTDVRLTIGPEEFSKIIKAMVETDRQAAMSAMAHNLLEQLEAQPALDVKRVKDTRAALLSDAAFKRIVPNSNVAAIVHDGIKDLIAEAEKSELDIKTTPIISALP